ncbi:carbohydrate porin [Celerinatantimonas sp. MCCC 1A17872]|uniref:carbohydrate porin n=1 Tax=Celerinatantimonas sp. MCCC 1A17872 TaxID=3177514 RepID=UPI0038C28D92
MNYLSLTKSSLFLYLATTFCAYAQTPPEKSNSLITPVVNQYHKLAQQGVHLHLSYTFETGGNLSGGTDHGYGYNDQTSLGMMLNLQKLLGLKGGQFHMVLTNRGGQADNINKKAHLGDQMQSLEVHGLGRTTRLSQFYYEQRLLNERLDFKLGRMPFGTEFGKADCNFTYFGLCGSQIGKYNGTIYGPTISQWSGNVTYHFLPSWAVKAGVYQNNASWLKNSQGLNFGNPKGIHGVTLPVELHWSPTIGLLHGLYKLGYWWDTTGGTDIATGQKHSHKHGLYFNASQQLMRLKNNPQRMLKLFVISTLNDPKFNDVERSIATGLTLIGPFASRVHDKFSIGVDYMHMSSHYAQSEKTANEAVSSDEVVFASYYRMQLGKHLELGPELQYIDHPGGTSHNANSWIATFKGTISF